MGIVFLLVVIVLPIVLIQYHSEMNKYDEFGMLTESVPFVNGRLNQHLSYKDAIILLAECR